MSLVFNMAGGASPKPVSLSIKTPPTKTAYTEGERFSTSGMVVQVTYSNGVTATVTGYSYSPTGALSMNNTAITISYTEGGVTVTATQSITVKKAYNATFANNTWAEIVEACHTNSVPSSWVVGDYKELKILNETYHVVIIGKNHDTYTSGGKAPLTFQTRALAGYGKMYEATGTNGWTNSYARKNMPNYLSRMPSEVQNGIREVNKLTASGGPYGSSLNTTAEKIFLLSEVEVTGKATNSHSGEGTQYAYYAAGNSTIKWTSEDYDWEEDSPYSWWLRSPAKQNYYFCVMSEWTSGQSYTAWGINSFYYPLAFCF